MAELKIRVGVSVDRGLDTALRPFLEGAKKAASVASAEGRKAGRSFATETKKGAKDAEAAFRDLEKEIAGGMKSATATGTAAVKGFAKETSTHFAMIKRQFADVARSAESEMKKMERAQRGGMPGAIPAAGSGARPRGPTVLTQAGRAALGIARSAGGAAYRLGMDVARAGGVEDVPSLMKNNVDLEKNAVDLVNAGYMPGKSGAAGQRQDPKVLIDEIRKAAIGTGTSSGETVTGLQAFVGKTGDLETGRGLMEQLNRLSKATGASTTDMADAAGDVSNALGDTDHKAEKVYAVMKAIAAQGKEGAVEIKDLAVQMAKLGAASGAFRGDHGAVMADMGTLAQMSRAKGGSASATQAATSVQSFVNTFDKAAREKAFKGFNVQTRDGSGKLFDAKTLIMRAIEQASSSEHGGMAKFSTNMGQMFMDARARSATRGFETVFKDAGGGAAGMKAVEEAYDKLHDAMMNETEIRDSFNLAMGTQASKAAVFNEQWATMLAEVQKQLLPALQSLTPLILDVTKDIAKAVGFLTGGPKDAAATEGQAASVAAQNARFDLRDSFAAHGGKVDQATVDRAEAEAKRLDAAIAEKQKNMTDAPGWLEKNAFTEQLSKEWFGSSWADSKQTRHDTDESQLKSMTGERAQLANYVEFMKGHTMKVEIVADRTARADGGTFAGPPPLDGSARQPPPEQRPR